MSAAAGRDVGPTSARLRQERGVVQQGDRCARTRGQTECLARGGGGCTQSARPEQRSAHGGQAPKEAGRSKRHTMRCGRPVSRRLGAGSGAVAHRPCGAMTRHFSLRGRALDQESNRCPVAHRPSRSGPIDLRVRRMENHRFKSDTHSNIGYRPAPFFVINQYVIRMYWWRRRESNPRPQALRLWLYMLSRVF